MEKLEKFQILVSCLIITFGLLIASVIFAGKISKDENITVTGSASKIVKSDSAKLGFSIRTRKINQKLIINDNIEVVILESYKNAVKIGVNAPSDVQIYREEVYNEIKKQESEIAEAAAEDLKKEIEKESEEKAGENITSDIEPIVEKVAEERSKKEIQKKHRELQEKEIELKQKESKLSKRLSDKQILLIGAKFALIQKAKGKTVEEILNQENFADSVKAADISFLEEDLELLKVM